MDKKKELILEKVKSWIKEVHYNPPHLLRTEYWLLKLNPKADLALRIAALAHDIERAFPKGRKPPIPETTRDWDDPIYNIWHGERSAEFTIRQLESWSIKDKILFDKITHLIKFHEEGGDKEIDLIKDADSLSFLEINLPRFISRVPNEMTKQEAKEKFDFMFNRISSPKARKLALPFYKKAIGDLKKV